MGWFGSGGSSDAPSEKSFASSDTGMGGMDHQQDMMGSMAAAGGGGGAAEIQQFSMGLQEQILIQNAVSLMADQAFEKCVKGNRRDGELSSKEVTCVYAVTNKWLDTNDFMAGRLGKKVQQQQQQQQFG